MTLLLINDYPAVYGVFLDLPQHSQQELGAGVLKGQDHALLHGELEASLDYETQSQKKRKERRGLPSSAQLPSLVLVVHGFGGTHDSVYTKVHLKCLLKVRLLKGWLSAWCFERWRNL